MTDSDNEILLKAIHTWKSEGIISEELANTLTARVQTDKKYKSTLAQYFFIFAITCILLSFLTIFIDDKIIEKIKLYLSVSNLVIFFTSTILTAISFYIIQRKKQIVNEYEFEIYTLLATLGLLISITYLCKIIGFGEYYTGYLSLTFITTFCLSLLLRSNSLFICSMVASVLLYGTLTTWQAVDGLFLKLNYPARFTVFGVFIVFFSGLFKRFYLLNKFYRLTYLFGIIILFTSLWGLSVFGNYSNFIEWQKVRQIQIVPYSILFGIFGFFLFFFGTKLKDYASRDIGVFAILANLYTIYFEFFWENINKGIFFIILALSFWMLGKQMEKRNRKKRNDK